MEKKTAELENYRLIPMNDIEPIAKAIAVRWHENATDWIGDKHKLASDIMNYAKNRIAASQPSSPLEWVKCSDVLPDSTTGRPTAIPVRFVFDDQDIQYRLMTANQIIDTAKNLTEPRKLEWLRERLSTSSPLEQDGWVRVEDGLPDSDKLVYIKRSTIHGGIGLVYIGRRMEKPLSKSEDLSKECYWHGTPVSKFKINMQYSKAVIHFSTNFNDQTVSKWKYVPHPHPLTTKQPI